MMRCSSLRSSDVHSASFQRDCLSRCFGQPDLFSRRTPDAACQMVERGSDGDSKLVWIERVGAEQCSTLDQIRLLCSLTGWHCVDSRARHCPARFAFLVLRLLFTDFFSPLLVDGEGLRLCGVAVKVKVKVVNLYSASSRACARL